MRLAHRKNSIDIVDELAARIDTIGHAIEPAESASQVVEEEMAVDNMRSFSFYINWGTCGFGLLAFTLLCLKKGRDILICE